MRKAIKDGLQLITLVWGAYSYTYLITGFSVYVLALSTTFSIMLGLATYQEYVRHKNIELKRWKSFNIKPTTNGPKEVLKDGKIQINHFEISSGYFCGVYKYDAWRELQG